MSRPSPPGLQPAVGQDPAAELIARALVLRASDIHLDPEPAGLRVRARVDGRFVDLERLDSESGQRLVSRLKVMAGLMVYRSDIPQEGRLDLAAGREGRLALIPTIDGEKATLRIFDPDTRIERLADLGFDPATNDWLRARLSAEHGLLVVVGPSGSGKTTTLYAAVGEIIAERGDFAHVMSIEDPVERSIPGCAQVQVDPIRQLDFAAGLKFLLRQDPEVVMVGEIRDAETARIAVRAAMTGHLVLASMHCGTADQARPRLLEMGVEPYAVDLALSGSIAQRLLRRLCESCHGQGCEDCVDTGFKGRVVIAEVLDGGEGPAEPDLNASGRALVAAGLTIEAELERVLGGAS